MDPNKFKRQLHYNTHFWTNTLGKDMGLIVSLQSFYKDDFGIW